MQSSRFSALRIIPFYLFLLPLFFVLHGYTEFYGLIPLIESLNLAGIYLLAGLFLFCIGWLLFRNGYKASLFAFLLLAFNFFFGPVHDFLKQTFPGSFISRYSFILSGAVILFGICVLLLKKVTKLPAQFIFYLNLLFIILLLFDSFRLVIKLNTLPLHLSIDLKKEFTPCNDCTKPDIYFIVADGYAGKQELKDIFNYFKI